MLDRRLAPSVCQHRGVANRRQRQLERSDASVGSSRANPFEHARRRSNPIVPHARIRREFGQQIKDSVQQRSAIGRALCLVQRSNDPRHERPDVRSVAVRGVGISKGGDQGSRTELGRRQGRVERLRDELAVCADRERFVGHTSIMARRPVLVARPGTASAEVLLQVNSGRVGPCRTARPPTTNLGPGAIVRTRIKAVDACVGSSVRRFVSDRVDGDGHSGEHAGRRLIM